jgi:hypothetical protein
MRFQTVLNRGSQQRSVVYTDSGLQIAEVEYNYAESPPKYAGRTLKEVVVYFPTSGPSSMKLSYGLEQLHPDYDCYFPFLRLLEEEANRKFPVKKIGVIAKITKFLEKFLGR